MEPLSFDVLSQGWNAIKANGAPNLRKIVSGFIDPSRIILQRVGETPDTLTVMFKGFDQALDDVEKSGPVLKRAILAWVKAFSAEAQIERGDPQTLILRIMKPPVANPAAQMAEAKWQKMKEILIRDKPTRGKMIDKTLVYITRKINA